MPSRHLHFGKLQRKCVSAENDMVLLDLPFGFVTRFQPRVLCFMLLIIFRKLRRGVRTSSIIFLLQVAVVDELLRYSHIFCPFLFGSNTDLPPHSHSLNPLFSYSYHGLIFKY